MELYGYELPFEELLPRIKEAHPDLESVGLQFPDGMRDHATEIAAIVEAELGAVPIVSADPCYGACDLCDDEMAKLGVTVLIHFGHSAMPSVPTQHGVQVYFVPAHSSHDITEVVERACREHLPEGTTKLGLCTTAQHAHKLEEAAELVRGFGLEPVIRSGDARTALPGQLLGCNVMAATAAMDADAFLFVGSGDFHPLALALETQKPIIAADPYHGIVANLETAKHRILKQRYAAIGQAKEAQTFGIVVSTKGGQMRFQLAQKMLQKLRAHGKEGTIIQNKQISPGDLLYFRHLDAFVGVACPRVPIDDQGRYDKPFLTPQELDIVLGVKKADLYVFDTYTAHSR
ncbi:MAG: diphthamide biosynthesis enzyme Dph2 [Thermoplasmatota archaeon]